MDKKVFTIGGLIGLGIVASFLIRARLDLLRIKQIKQELNQE
jgi:uncharacterized membrane protein YciS (DUF1049 family)|tara:strand:+ start:342 stop:467 length:126 start_codon:yes stop_codon:yes gene_type:complete